MDFGSIDDVKIDGDLLNKKDIGAFDPQDENSKKEKFNSQFISPSGDLIQEN